jgi:hypothetical protein
MTKTIVLGEPKDKAINKPIEFFTHIHVSESDEISAEPVDSRPHEWGFIELICKDYAPNLDLMFAYDDAGERSNGILMVGRWNDGVVQVKHHNI